MGGVHKEGRHDFRVAWLAECARRKELASARSSELPKLLYTWRSARRAIFVAAGDRGCRAFSEIPCGLGAKSNFAAPPSGVFRLLVRRAATRHGGVRNIGMGSQSRSAPAWLQFGRSLIDWGLMRSETCFISRSEVGVLFFLFERRFLR